VTDARVPSTDHPGVDPATDIDHASAVADADLLAEVNAELGAVDDALRRLDDGTYGKCEVCGSELDSELLEADPFAIRCSDHGA
jgi:RNA polymerase-binding transcription factor DksA